MAGCSPSVPLRITQWMTMTSRVVLIAERSPSAPLWRLVPAQSQWAAPTASPILDQLACGRCPRRAYPKRFSGDQHETFADWIVRDARNRAAFDKKGGANHRCHKPRRRPSTPRQNSTDQGSHDSSVAEMATPAVDGLIIAGVDAGQRCEWRPP
jgi:hypothetical protein